MRQVKLQAGTSLWICHDCHPTINDCHDNNFAVIILHQGIAEIKGFPILTNVYLDISGEQDIIIDAFTESVLTIQTNRFYFIAINNLLERTYQLFQYSTLNCKSTMIVSESSTIIETLCAYHYKNGVSCVVIDLDHRDSTITSEYTIGSAFLQKDRTWGQLTSYFTISDTIPDNLYNTLHKEIQAIQFCGGLVLIKCFPCLFLTSYIQFNRAVNLLKVDFCYVMQNDRLINTQTHISTTIVRSIPWPILEKKTSSTDYQNYEISNINGIYTPSTLVPMTCIPIGKDRIIKDSCLTFVSSKGVHCFLSNGVYGVLYDKPDSDKVFVDNIQGLVRLKNNKIMYLTPKIKEDSIYLVRWNSDTIFCASNDINK
jgi:hypothetical protein